MLEPYAPKGVERILPEFKDSENPSKWVGIDAWETAFIVNKSVLASKGVTEIPASYEDLADPMYKGLIAMSNPASSGTGTLTVNGILTLMGEEKGWEYLDKLHENVSVYLHSGSAPAKNTATGEYASAFHSVTAALNPLRKWEKTVLWSSRKRVRDGMWKPTHL